MYITSAQTLQLNLIYLEAHGLNILIRLGSLLLVHCQGNFVNKCSATNLRCTI